MHTELFSLRPTVTCGNGKAVNILPLLTGKVVHINIFSQ